MICYQYVLMSNLELKCPIEINLMRVWNPLISVNNVVIIMLEFKKLILNFIKYVQINVIRLSICLKESMY